MIPRPPRSTHFPYTTLFRSAPSTIPKLLSATSMSSHSACQSSESATACNGSRITSAEKWNPPRVAKDRKSTRLNSSHVEISYAVFCLKKKNMQKEAHKAEEP